MHDTDAPAPGELRLVQQLVNTFDLEEGTDALDGAWPASVGLGASQLSDAEVDRVLRLREALRGVLLSHNGLELDPATVAELSALGRSASVVVGFDASGEAQLKPSGDGADAVIASLLAIVARASVEGTWERLKVCPADDCRWAFYDFSRNHSRTWCDMKVCGNRAKARTYRSRRG